MGRGSAETSGPSICLVRQVRQDEGDKGSDPQGPLPRTLCIPLVCES